MDTSVKNETVHPVDEMLPLGKLTALGFQHVMVMYAGAVAVPLIVGRALNLSPEHLVLLISADLFACGITTFIQSFGVTRWFGIQLPVMMGVTFTAVSPMISIGLTHGSEGLNYIFGAGIAAGAISIFLAPLVSKVLKFFPPVVTGTIILVIGLSLMKVAIDWVVGDTSHVVNPQYTSWLKQVNDLAATGQVPAVPAGFQIAATQPDVNYASPEKIGIAAFVMACVLLISKYTKGFISNIAVLLGIFAGAILVAALGMMSFEKVHEAVWFQVVLPFQFGMPKFDAIAIITMLIVMIVSFIESTGMFLALGEIVGTKVDSQRLSRGLRTDALGTLIGGVFNTFPYTSFSENVGLVSITGVRSRFVCVAGAVILILMGFVPKMGALVESIPTYVLGGAGIVMFGMIAAAGVRILAGVDYSTNRFNLFIVAVAVGIGLLPLLAPDYKLWIPKIFHTIIESSILLTTVFAVFLNYLFNGLSSDEEAHREVLKVHGSD